LGKDIRVLSKGKRTLHGGIGGGGNREGDIYYEGGRGSPGFLKKKRQGGPNYGCGDIDLIKNPTRGGSFA